MSNQNEFKYKGFVKKSFLCIIRALEGKYKLGKIRLEIENLINEYPMLNKFQKSRLYDVVYKVSRAVATSTNWEKEVSKRIHYDRIMAEAHKIWEEVYAKKKNNDLRTVLNNRGSDVIFFKCSEHYNPAKDHKDFQGKIYVNRFWRTRISEELYPSVLSYIRQNKVVSVQKIMGAPVYLTTRPYCKHFFIPLNTNDVLLNNVNNGKIKNKNYNYYETKNKIYEQLNKVHPCTEFEKKIKGRN